MLELAAQILVLRWLWAVAAPILTGAVMVIGVCVALAVDGNWLPLAFLIAVVALVVGTIRRVSRRMQREQTLGDLDAQAWQVRDYARERSLDAPNGRRSSGLRAVYSDRLDPARRWASK